MFEPSFKKGLLAVLVLCFLVQSVLVYTDHVDLELSAKAIEGRRLYHESACQVCHQLWGQGGFLGPDLTNAASRVDETRLVSLLTVGSGQMPALSFNPRQIDQMNAFLKEIDRRDIGGGELRMGDPSTGTNVQEAFESAIIDLVPPTGTAAGFETFRTGMCKSCHFPFQTSIVGAPDLSTTVERLSETELTEVLTSGRPEAGMPPPVPGLSTGQIDDLISYFFWLNANRAELEGDTHARQEDRTVNWRSLPWWEYR